MRLLRTEFENCCQHRSLTHEWHGGLNGIVGPNGAGKSNTLKLIEAGLTGSFSALPGNKEHNVALLAPANSRARIRIELEHGDARIEVVRALRGPTTEAKVNGGTAVRGDTRVNALLADILGVDSRILAEFVFVKQRSIFAFLDAQDSVRAALFQKLFGTERALAIHGLLGKELSSLQVVQPSAEIEPLVARVQAAEERLVRAYANYRKLTGTASNIQAAEDVISRRERAKQVRRECRQLRQDSLGVREQLREQKPQFEHAQAELDMLQAAIAELAPAVEQAQAARAEWLRYTRDQQARANLEKETQKLQIELAALVEVTIPADLEQAVQDWNENRDELVAQIAWNDQLIRTFNGQTAECPTCGTPADTLADKVEAARAVWPGLLEMRTAGMAAEREYRTLTARRQAWQASVTRLESRLDQAARALTALGPEVPEPEFTKAQIDEIMGDHAAFQEALKNEILPSHTKIIRGVDQLRARLQTYKAQYRTRRSQAPAQIPSRDEYRAARLQLRREQKRATRRKVLELRIRDYEKSLIADKALLARLREEAESARKTQAWADELRVMQGAVHFSALPRLVSQDNLALVQDDVNDLLARFGVRFRIEPTEELSFNVRYDDGRVHAATRLSDGQKVVFALAFRVAVNALFTGDIGLFCLDEPTDSLDAKNLACLELALDRLRELSHSRGLQCLLVTHERKLTRLFDAVLELS